MVTYNFLDRFFEKAVFATKKPINFQSLARVKVDGPRDPRRDAEETLLLGEFRGQFIQPFPN
jgi:hypothetical protein